MEGQRKCVYINPNFNKVVTHQQNVVKPLTTMHVNPAFSYHMPYSNPPALQKTKIFINPNFIPPTQYAAAPQIPVQAYSNQLFVATHGSDQIQPCSSQVAESSSRNNAIVTKSSLAAMQLEAKSRLQPVITNTRYSLIRHEQKKTINNYVLEKPKNTITVSRYKTIKVNDMRKSLENIKPPNIPLATETHNKTKELAPKKFNKYKFVRQNSKTQMLSKCYKIKETSLRKYGNKYKLVRQNSSLMKKDISILRCTKNIGKITIKTKKIVNLAIRSRYKYTKTVIGKLKKNNIPCPLYRKYGRCLRKDNGICDFLHDRKHVSVCRKFLKGLCFDENCLFSHDLSSKKMPTCYFYLKGACCKEICPYLHVKLNDDTIICPDFLKGYCEKGSECTKRHINLCPDYATKGVCLKKSCTYPHKNNKTKKNTNQPKQPRIKPVVNKVSKERGVKDQHPEKDHEELIKDSRYYKEDLDKNNVCENIKPTRCKIGTLPSFIKL